MVEGIGMVANLRLGEDFVLIDILLLIYNY